MALHASNFLESLGKKLSPSSQILKDHDSVDFKTSAQRWSDIDIRVPGAILKPVNEQDTITIVQEALNAGVPFVPACGGHSTWSTVGDEGFVLDLSLFKDVVFDPATSSVKVKGGILTKDLQVALASHKQFTVVGNGNTVGVIPYYLNGGISAYSPLIGYGCDNILHARLITAAGQVVMASESENADLLWAIRGAGQFFGVVIELCIHTYPFAKIGNPDGSRSMGTFIFPVAKAEAVCEAVNSLVNNETHITAGHCMIVAPPPVFKQVIMVSAQFLGPEEKTDEAFTPLSSIEPIKTMISRSSFEGHSDHLAKMCEKGEFKRFNQVGIHDLTSQNFTELIDIHGKLLATCSDASRSGFTIEWHSRGGKPPSTTTSFGNHNVHLWLNTLSWYTDAANHSLVADFDAAAQSAMRRGTEKSSFITYANATREVPIEERYKGSESIQRLKELKMKWDSTGVFTKELL